MAQGDFFQMGVVVEVKNPSFRFGTEKTTTLNGNYVPGTHGVTLTVNSTSPALTKLFKAQDRILVGPSTNTTDSGRRETRQITAVTATTFTLKTALTYSYQNTDPVGGIGTNLVGGWTPAGNVVPSGMDGGGKDDEYGQKLDFGGATSDYLEQTGLATLEPANVYRVGFYHRSSGGDTNDKIRVKVHDGSSYFIGAATSVDMAGKGTYTRYTDTGTTNATWTNLSAAQVRFEWMAGTPTDVEIDLVWLEHAKSLSTSSLGFYTFTEKPNLGLTWEREAQWSRRRLANQTLRRHGFCGGAQKTLKSVVDMRFQYVTQVFWDDLMLLQRWQDKGHLLTFHPSLDDLPPVLIGIMTVVEDRKVSKEHWALGRRSFDMTFMEA